MVYVKQEWIGSLDPLVGDPGSTPLSAERMEHLETQYDEAVDFVDERTDGISIRQITQDAYDALPTPRPDNVLYIITA